VPDGQHCRVRAVVKPGSPRTGRLGTLAARYANSGMWIDPLSPGDLPIAAIGVLRELTNHVSYRGPSTRCTRVNVLYRQTTQRMLNADNRQPRGTACRPQSFS
jgi:hypothetical protein